MIARRKRAFWKWDAMMFTDYVRKDKVDGRACAASPARTMPNINRKWECEVVNTTMRAAEEKATERKQLYDLWSFSVIFKRVVYI